jgi:CRP/FNR family transcriptional regulator, cyclic AMP receptor protein
MNVFTGLSLFPDPHASIRPVAGADIEVLKKMPLFRELDASGLAALAARARLRRCLPREAIVQQDIATDGVYLITRGRAIVSVANRDGRSVTIRELGPGEIIGEISLLDGGVPSATVTAMTKTELVGIGRRSFLELLEQRPQIAVALLPVLASRLRRLTAWADDLAGLPLPARLAKCLLGMVSEHGQRVGPKRLRISQKVSQQELARRIGVTRESINKHLRRLERAGVTVQEAGYLIVTDLEQLQAAASVD